MHSLDTLVIGAGQAGLSISYHLTQMEREHLLLEKERMFSAWRDRRWDSFTLVTPNRQLKLPGAEYDGDDPDGFLSREEVVQYLHEFVASFDPPVQEGVEATAVERVESSDGFLIRTSAGDFEARNVVVAAGTFQEPNIPAFSSNLSDDVTQVHSSQYRNPGQLPPGPVLVVGSGQSGCQIAEELNESGRDVYLCTGSALRLPRRYRGQDATLWLQKTGFLDRTVDQLESPEERFAPNPHVSGKDGGHTINLHRFARQGIQLLGRLQGAQDSQLTIAPDLHDNLRAADEFAREFKQGVDKFIEQQGVQAPDPDESELRAGYDVPIVTKLDLDQEQIGSVIWATGYEFDFSWVDLPVFDEYGYPIQQRGVTEVPGLYFLGLHWLHTIKSGLLFGVGDDAAHVAEHIEANR